MRVKREKKRESEREREQERDGTKERERAREREIEREISALSFGVNRLTRAWNSSPARISACVKVCTSMRGLDERSLRAPLLWEVKALEGHVFPGEKTPDIVLSIY